MATRATGSCPACAPGGEVESPERSEDLEQSTRYRRSGVCDGRIWMGGRRPKNENNLGMDTADGVHVHGLHFSFKWHTTKEFPLEILG